MSDRVTSAGEIPEPPAPIKGPEPMPDSLVVMDSGVARPGPLDPPPKVVKTGEYVNAATKSWSETLLSTDPASYSAHTLALRAILWCTCLKFDTDDTLPILPHPNSAENLIPLAQRLITAAPLLREETKVVLRNIDVDAVQGAQVQLTQVIGLLGVLMPVVHELTAKRIQLEHFLDDTLYSVHGRVKGLVGVSRRLGDVVAPINEHYRAAAVKAQETKKLTAKVAEKATQDTLDKVEEELAKQRPGAPAPGPAAPTPPPVATVLPPELRRGLKRPGRK